MNMKKFKVHGYDSVTGLRRSSNNLKFYDTLDEARRACARMASTGATLVIFESIEVVSPAKPPVVAQLIMPNGELDRPYSVPIPLTSDDEEVSY